jgi:UDP-3-O-[3-hydroxymyristoyl] glucosamine N-acyltransferase
LDRKIKIKEILVFLNQIEEDYSFKGNIDDSVQGYSSFHDYKPNTITWIRSNIIYETTKDSLIEPIKLIIAPQDFLGEDGCLNCIKTEDPHREFFYILKEFFDVVEQPKSGRNNSIAPSAQIGDQVLIGSNCIIGERVSIGEGCRIYDNVVIHDNVQVGKNCLIQSGAVIGEEGFGFLTSKNGSRERVIHFGTVIIGDNVEIGANTCIARGVMEDTLIGNGSKIDNLCHIGHNVRIGSNAFVVAHTMIGGSSKIGDNCWIATSTIRNGISIGDNALVGFGSVVVKNVEAGAVVYGNPAKNKEVFKEK